MRRIISCLIFSVVTCYNAVAQIDVLRGPNIAIGTKRNPTDSSRTARINVGLLGSVDTLRGLQLNLLRSDVGKESRGVNMGLVTAVSRHNMTGLQVGSFFNGVGDTVRGAQISGLTNISDHLRGAQVAGFSNIALEPMRGLQLSVLTNIAQGGMVRGAQISGVVNVSAGPTEGLQLAAYNYADSLGGIQLGAINVARTHPRGWQVGLLNITRDTLAHKIGLVNVSPRTQIDMLLFGGNSSKINLALRFRNRSTYNIVGFGTHYMGLDKKFSGALYYRIGQYFQLSPRWSLSGDVGYFHVETFEHNTSGKPQRLFSLQARLNADFQINRLLGAFVSAGYGTTRRYYHWHHYRSRPIFEAGLSLRYQRAAESALDERSVLENEPIGGDSLLAPQPKKRPWLAAAEATGINVLVHCFDRFIMNEDFAQTTLRSIRHNFKNGFVWDNDQFSTNLFAHPYHGNLYYNAARSNGLSFYESAPYALAGSLMWEFFGEIEPPAINDLIATTCGGICIGEITHRISDLILNDRSRGFRRFLREFSATLICPMKGLNRICRGEAWHVRQQNYLHHDYSLIPVDFSLSVGDRYLADDGALFRGEHNPYINVFLEYGHAITEEGTKTPYDFFSFESTVGLSKNQPLINRLNLLGRLWSKPVVSEKRLSAEFGIYQYFNYYDSKPVKDGSNQTPYRISEAASFGPGLILSLPEIGALNRLEQRFFVGGVLLGGTKSDYYNVIDRDYNMGSGFSLKSKTFMEFRHFGRFIFKADYFRLFTWKGYEGKDLEHIDPIYLNAQGDKGNAGLLVLSPMWEIDLKNALSLNLSSSYFVRQTHYAYHPDVHTNTFELAMGLTYHF